MLRKILLPTLFIIAFAAFLNADKGWYGVVDMFDRDAKSGGSTWSANHMKKLLMKGYYTKAHQYFNKIKPTLDSLPVRDKGELYHYNGVALYMLCKNNASYFNAARSAFTTANSITTRQNIREYSILWHALLYESFGNSSEDYQSGVSLLNGLISDYPESRFVNDAVFYKAILYRKMGNTEYSVLLDKAMASGYADSELYSKWHQTYIPASRAVKYYRSAH